MSSFRPTHDTFAHKDKFWSFPPDNFISPHPHSAYVEYGRGVAPEMRVTEIGIAPRPLRRPHPPLYGGFTHSMRTAKFWARYKGKPIVLGLMICAPTDTQAQEQFRDMEWFWNQWSMQFGQGLPMLVGSPDTIARKIEAAAKAVPIKECFLLIPQGIHTPEQINNSLELFATKVMPRFAA